jgi:thiol-disulfide isomerase/thioredoxin
VDYDSPAAEETERCTAQAKSEGGASGWYVFDPAGQLLRRFLDTNKDNKVDQWCYYKAGVEVYRDVDSNFNGKADQYRWLGTSGIRWGLDDDEDGRIDRWKVISAEELTMEVVAALRERDAQRFARLLPSTRELEALGLGELQTTEIAKKVAAARSGFAALAAKQTLVAAGTHWLHFGGSRPGLVPTGFEGSTRDVIVYDSVSAIVETDGKSSQLTVGTLIQVDGGWRVIDLPGDLDDSAAMAGGYFFQQVPSRQPEMIAGASAGISEQTQKLMNELEDLDKAIEAAGSPAELAKLHAARADRLQALSAAAATAEEQETWLRQFADTVSAAAQSGSYPDGVQRLKGLADSLEQRSPGSDTAAFCKYRYLQADYADNLQKPGTDFPAIQQKWLTDLGQFAQTYPRSEDAADAMLQLALGEEFAGKLPEAIAWYDKILGGFPQSLLAKKAAGAKRRLQSVGAVIPLTGTTLEGKAVSLEAYKGRTVLIHYWATWCEPCKQDLPVLKNLQAKYAQQGFVLIGVNLDSDKAMAAAYLQNNPLSWPQLYEPGGLDSRLANELGILTLPTMILVDKEGKVLNRNIHAGELDEELAKRLR